MIKECMRKSLILVLFFMITSVAVSYAGDISYTGDNLQWNQVAPGVWKSHIGAVQPTTLLEAAGAVPAIQALDKMGGDSPFPLNRSSITATVDGRTTVLSLPLRRDERIFGLGLQFKTIDQRGSIRYLHVDHYGGVDNGRTHAPVPFYVTSAGYGVLVDSAEYITVYAGTANRKGAPDHPPVLDRNTDPNWNAVPPSNTVEILVPADGVDIYIFAGPTPLDAVRRYNLYCGGGCLPPRWGLGFWHRTPMRYTSSQVEQEAREFISRGYPLDVIGLEPGWHSKSYPCTYQWDTGRFPDPKGFVGTLRSLGVRVNLWENPYVSPDSELYPLLEPLSGSHTVWCGIVPDYSLPEARRYLMDQHDREHLAIGVSGYKIDECDGIDIWLWPDLAVFPSGLTAMQMRQTSGLRLQRMIDELFRSRNTRTYGLVRGSNAGSSPLPFVIYNDYYSHRDFITALCNSGFCGILWTPEVRASESPEEWLRRMQSVCFSPLAMINAWSDGTKPWSYPEVEDDVRAVMELRVRMIPYLYSAFARYRFEGIPPFRPMELEPGFLTEGDTGARETVGTRNDRKKLIIRSEVKDQYMMGDNLLVAPMFAGESERDVVLPPGAWYDFYTGAFAGKDEVITVTPGPGHIPLFVRDGGIIPLAPVGLHAPVQGEGVGLEIRHYGSAPGHFLLYDDDGETFDYERGEYVWRELTVTKSSQGRLEGDISPFTGSFPSTYGEVVWRFMSE